MELSSLASKYKRELIFLIKLISIYLGLYLSITIFIGITVEGGLVYWSWAQYNINFIGNLRYVLLSASEFILNLIGYDTLRGEYHLRIVDKSGIRLVYECLGLELTSGYIALILAYRIKIILTLVYSLIGLFLIQILNTVRIVLLVHIYSSDRDDIFSFIDHHDIFNVMVILVLFVLFRSYTSKLKVDEPTD